jgi:acyl CoA:acetate/3-ketoacid CoA transferase beta subunit
MAELPADFTLDELCAVACAEAWRGDGEILASPIGIIPGIGARLAKATFAPDLLLSDGVASLLANITPVSGGGPRVGEGWVPYRTIFDIVWSGRRHVMMGATQIDRFGNQNIACIGEWNRPKAQLLGMRGAPGNTINHPTSYWIPNHSTRSFVAQVDVVSGVGYDRAAKLGAGGRFHEIRRVVSNKGVFDFETPDHAMRIRSVHPGVTVDDVVKNTGFPLVVPKDVPETRRPTPDELRLIREVIDPAGLGKKELKG